MRCLYKKFRSCLFIYFFFSNPYYSPYYELPWTVKVEERLSDFLESKIIIYITFNQLKYLDIFPLRAHFLVCMLFQDCSHIKFLYEYQMSRCKEEQKKRDSDLHRVLQNTKLRFFNEMQPICT